MYAATVSIRWCVTDVVRQYLEHIALTAYNCYYFSLFILADVLSCVFISPTMEKCFVLNPSELVCFGTQVIALTGSGAWAALWNVNKKNKKDNFHWFNIFINPPVWMLESLLCDLVPLTILYCCCCCFSTMSWCLRLWPQSWEDFTSTLARCSSGLRPTRRERVTRWDHLLTRSTESHFSPPV